MKNERKPMNKKYFPQMYKLAHEMGLAAADKCHVTPMVVAQHANPANDASPVEERWFVEGGVCGFAWVKIRPANCPFANWLKKNIKDLPGGNRVHHGFHGGLEIWISAFGQSMQRKEAYASGFAKTLGEFGIWAHADSRID